jgi:hypothetical protein
VKPVIFGERPWEMTVSTRSSPISIWDILSVWCVPYYLVDQLFGRTANLEGLAVLDGPASHGGEIQLESMKLKLKAPGTERLKIIYENLLSSFAFDFNMRHYITTGVFC